MHVEIQVALNFLISFLYNKLPRRRVNQFAEELENIVKQKFDGHWYPEEPYKGSAYRCIHCNPLLDSTLFREAALQSGLNLKDVQDNLPHELSIWIDPGEVSYRITEKSPVNILYSSKMDCHQKPNQKQKPNANEQHHQPIGLNPEAQCFRPIVESTPTMIQNKILEKNPNIVNNQHHQINIHKPQPIMINNNLKINEIPPLQRHPNSHHHLHHNHAHPTTTVTATAINPLATIPFNTKQHEPVTFTTATFAATKFGSTKPKTQMMKKNSNGIGVGGLGYPRVSPVENKFLPRKCSNGSNGVGGVFLQPTQLQSKDIFNQLGNKTRLNFSNNSPPITNTTTNNNTVDIYFNYNNGNNGQHLPSSAQKRNELIGWPSINEANIILNGGGKNNVDEQSTTTMPINGRMIYNGNNGNSNAITNGLSSIEQLLTAATVNQMDYAQQPITPNNSINNDFQKYFSNNNGNSSNIINNEQTLFDSIPPLVPNNTDSTNNTNDENNLNLFDGFNNVPFMPDQLLREIFELATTTTNNTTNTTSNDDDDVDHPDSQIVANNSNNNSNLNINGNITNGNINGNANNNNDLIDCSGFPLSSSSWSSNELSSSVIINEFDNLSLNSNSSSSLGSVSSYVT